MSDLAAQ